MINNGFIILILLSHIAFISTSGVHTVSMGMKTFNTDFFIMPTVTQLNIDGKPVSITPVLSYDNATLKNVTMNLITLIDYMKNNLGDYLAPSQINSLSTVEKGLKVMMASNTFDLNQISSSENLVFQIYMTALTGMRNDKYSLLKTIRTYEDFLSSPALPMKLKDNADELKSELKKFDRTLSSYDYGIAYYFNVLKPEGEELINRADFIVKYPQVLDEMNTINSVFEMLSSAGVLSSEDKQWWDNDFRPTYVKFVRGLYVQPNITQYEEKALTIVNRMKMEALDNLDKAGKKVNGYTNPPFYQKGKYEKLIKQYSQELQMISIKKVDNESFSDIQTVVRIYKESKSLPSKVHKLYIEDALGTIIVMLIVVRILLYRSA